jgi:hypothetical protein
MCKLVQLFLVPEDCKILYNNYIHIFKLNLWSRFISSFEKSGEDMKLYSKFEAVNF